MTILTNKLMLEIKQVINIKFLDLFINSLCSKL